MSALTSLLYGVLLAYLGGWYMDKWSGNFSLLLFILAVVTFFYWLAERFYFAPKRQQAVLTLEKQDLERRAQLSEQGIAKVDGDTSAARNALLQQPWWLDWTAGLFPVILVVFLLRSFLFEPFKIPSPSMVPTLRIGDLILVNKFHYGVRLPVINQKIMALNDPKAGDVMVFRYPQNTSIDYIKRVVGVPGDEVSYRNKLLYLNGQLVETQPLEDFFDDTWADSRARQIYSKQFNEKLGTGEHRLLVDRDQPNFISPFDAFPFKENCNYTAEGVTCKVPPGHYFMMGDNRDHSEDSRFWGFVPDKNIVGKAFFIWMNFSNFKRFGPFN
jgi:signal peptidase I